MEEKEQLRMQFDRCSEGASGTLELSKLPGLLDSLNLKVSHIRKASHIRKLPGLLDSLNHIRKVSHIRSCPVCSTL